MGQVASGLCFSSQFYFLKYNSLKNSLCFMGIHSFNVSFHFINFSIKSSTSSMLQYLPD